MALRNIRVNDDPILRKKSRDITEINNRIMQIRDDMLETMHDAKGVGLAAPQIGILRSLVVIDVGEGPLTLINPVILQQSGSQIDSEGCLSLPGKNSKVERPFSLTLSYTDLQGVKKELDAEGLLARVICHEIDHLDGILFIDRTIEGSD